MSKTKINCKQCNKECEVENRDINRGGGKFCCVTCANQYRAAHVKKLELNVECSWCNKKFHLPLSKLANSKSRLYFCCRNHKDSAQKVGGIKEIMPSHYGTAAPDNNQRYRRIAFENKPKICERCKYDQHPAAIIVHHKDRNRMNDSIENLEVLCANCHAIEHWSSNDFK
jgi:hypothetical protein